MAMSVELTPLQLAVMRVLWERGEATAAEVHGAVAKVYRPSKPLRHPPQPAGAFRLPAPAPDRRISQSAVATVLSRLEAQGVVEHRREGRQYVFSPVVAESEVRRAAVGRLADRFSENVVALVAQLLAGRRVSREELEEVKALVEAKERELDEEDGA